MSYKQIVFGFMRAGVLGYGGGPSVIPLFRYETVQNYKWMDDEEFGELLAMANALPGPIATKMAAYIGYRVKGILGAVVAILAHIIPSAIAMIALLALLHSMKNSPVVEGMVSAISPVIGVMLALMANEFFGKTKKAFGWSGGFGYIAAALIALQLLDIHPALVILLFLAFALGKNAVSRKVYRQVKGGETLK
ncbi:chromate transporter [Ferviditalea candida]|uniref:Chromate transporter n=1 Tax=Ferviditalea candida TaxID=3108399 RepID=A0ABU5ZGE1_9BACL|nr:chromate transporter [Paenibacillaceae bacterium T2]